VLSQSTYDQNISNLTDCVCIGIEAAWTDISGVIVVIKSV